MLTDRINIGKQKTEVYNGTIGILGGNIPGADAVRQIEKLEITEGEYEKLRELFLRDVNLFYEAVKKGEDFRLVFLYCFSKMACEVYDRYCVSYCCG